MDIQEIQNKFNERMAQEEEAKNSEKVARFCNSLGTAKYIFADGHESAFIGGVFHTSDEQEYYELAKEIHRGHPHIYQEAGKELVLRSEMDPELEMKRKAMEYDRIMQERAANLEAGDTDQGKLSGIGNTDTTGVTAAESSSGSGSALAMLKANQRGATSK